MDDIAFIEHDTNVMMRIERTAESCNTRNIHGTLVEINDIIVTCDIGKYTI